MNTTEKSPQGIGMLWGRKAPGSEAGAGLKGWRPRQESKLLPWLYGLRGCLVTGPAIHCQRERLGPRTVRFTSFSAARRFFSASWSGA